MDKREKIAEIIRGDLGMPNERLALERADKILALFSKSKWVKEQSYIELKCGGLTLVDREALEDLEQFNWTLNDRGYVVRYKNTKEERYTEYLARRIMGNPEKTVDHINNDKLDNRRSNLRICSIGENNYNRPPNGNKKYSKYKGVSRNRPDKFVAQIMFKGKNKYLGEYDTAEEAALAYNKKAEELFGEHAYLNKVEQGWISVEDRLPEEDGIYMAKVKGEGTWYGVTKSYILERKQVKGLIWYGPLPPPPPKGEVSERDCDDGNVNRGTPDT